jgi:hypothetical protein
MSNLQTIISSKAIFPSITTMLNRELMTDHTTLIQITKHPDMSVIYILALGATLYAEYKYVAPIDKRYQIFETYQNTKKTINIFALTMLFVFFRNIENAI